MLSVSNLSDLALFYSRGDEAPLVVLMSGIAGRVEDLHRTGHLGRADRGARYAVAGSAE